MKNRMLILFAVKKQSKFPARALCLSPGNHRRRHNREEPRGVIIIYVFITSVSSCADDVSE